MIRILSITIYNAGNSDVLDYEAFYDKKILTESGLQRWTNRLEKYYEEVYETPVRVYAHRRKRPPGELDMMKILAITSDVMKQDVENVSSGKRNREFVDVRKVVCQIIHDADYNPLEMEKQLPFQNRVIYKYLLAMQNRFETEKNFRIDYQAIRDEVMNLSVNGEQLKD